jgi:hypothetical protein
LGILRIDLSGPIDPERPLDVGILCLAAGRVGTGGDRGTLGHDPAEHPILSAGAPLGRLSSVPLPGLGQFRSGAGIRVDS